MALSQQVAVVTIQGRKGMQDDQHPHESRQRKQSSGHIRQLVLKHRRLQLGSTRNSDSFCNSRIRGFQAEKHVRPLSSPTDDITHEIEDELSPFDADEVCRSDCNPSADSAKVDFAVDIGDMEYVQEEKCLSSKSRTGRASHSTTLQQLS